MKTTSLAVLCVMLICIHVSHAAPAEGFFLPDSVREITFSYKSINNLIVLPVRLNNSQTVNLVLDTGCRNLVLFGKRFEHMIERSTQRTISFNGLGTGQSTRGFITLENDVSFNKVTGKKIAIVVVPDRNVFRRMPEIDGVIGYELFLKFEIEIDFSKSKITFRPAMYSHPSPDFTLVPMRIEDARPMLSCMITFENGDQKICDLLIDTGSCLGLLYTTHIAPIPSRDKVVLGKGINGNIQGIQSTAQQLHFGSMSLSRVPTGIVMSDTHHYASLGTGVLKDYTLLLNYYKSYAGLREHQ